MSTGLLSTRFSPFTAPWTTLLRGYVSKSSAALNPLTITQLACELSMRGRSLTALLGPSYQLTVRRYIMRIIVPRMRIPALRVSTLVHFINYCKHCTRTWASSKHTKCTSVAYVMFLRVENPKKQCHFLSGNNRGGFKRIMGEKQNNLRLEY